MHSGNKGNGDLSCSTEEFVSLSPEIIVFSTQETTLLPRDIMKSGSIKEQQTSDVKVHFTRASTEVMAGVTADCDFRD